MVRRIPGMVGASPCSLGVCDPLNDVFAVAEEREVSAEKFAPLGPVAYVRSHRAVADDEEVNIAEASYDLPCGLDEHVVPLARSKVRDHTDGDDVLVGQSEYSSGAIPPFRNVAVVGFEAVGNNGNSAVGYFVAPGQARPMASAQCDEPIHQRVDHPAGQFKSRMCRLGEAV